MIPAAAGWLKYSSPSEEKPNAREEIVFPDREKQNGDEEVESRLGDPHFKKMSCLDNGRVVEGQSLYKVDAQ